MAIAPKRWWKSRSPEQRKRIKIYGSLLGAVGVSALLVTLTQHHLKLNNAIHATKTSKTSFAPSFRNYSGKSTAAEVLNLKNQIQELRAIVAAQDHISTSQLQQAEKHLSAKMLAKLRKEPIYLQQSSVSQKQMAQLRADLAHTQSELQSLQHRSVSVPYTPGIPTSSALTAPYRSPGLSFPGVTKAQPVLASHPSSSRPSSAPPAPPKTLLTASPHLHLSISKHQIVKVSSKKAVFLPAGSIITGVTLNGIQAPTGPGSRDNPQIVDIRVKKDVVLPNGYRSSVRNCDILASGHGSLESHRVYLRTNTLSCVTDGGGIISAPMKGYIVGSDGMIGVKGTLISHQGPLMVKSLISGIFAGLGGSGAPTENQGLELNPSSGSTQNFQLPNPEYIGASALAGGIQTAAGQISQFYLKEAEAMQPVVQINPGISVSIILEYGSHVSLVGNTKRQIQSNNYAVSQEMNQNLNTGTATQPGMVTGDMPVLAPSAAPVYPGSPVQDTSVAQQRAAYAAPESTYPR